MYFAALFVEIFVIMFLIYIFLQMIQFHYEIDSNDRGIR